MSDYVTKHAHDGLIRRGALQARIDRVKRQRRLQQVYDPSIHSMEDDAPAWDDPRAGVRARAMIERRTQRPEDCASSAEFVHPA